MDHTTRGRVRAGLVAVACVAALAALIVGPSSAHAEYSRPELRQQLGTARADLRVAAEVYQRRAKGGGVSEDDEVVLAGHLEVLRARASEASARLSKAQGQGDLAKSAKEIGDIATKAQALRQSSTAAEAALLHLGEARKESVSLLDQWDSLARTDYRARQRAWSLAGAHAIADEHAASIALAALAPVKRKPTAEAAIKAARSGTMPAAIAGLVPTPGGCALPTASTSQFLGNASSDGPQLWTTPGMVEEHQDRVADAVRASVLEIAHRKEIGAAGKELARSMDASAPTPYNSRSMRLGYAWLVTEDERYADQMLADLKELLSGAWTFEDDIERAKVLVTASTMVDWLDTTGAARGIEDDLDWITEALAVRSLGWIACELAKGSKLVTSKLNKSVIFDASAIVAALAFAPRMPDASAAIVAAALKAGRSNWAAMDSDGGSPEGATYWNFQSLEAAALVSTADGVYGSRPPAGMPTFRRAADFAYHASDTTGLLPMYSDTRDAQLRSTLPAWIAGRYGDPAAAALAIAGHLRESVQVLWWPKDDAVAPPDREARAFPATGLAVVHVGSATAWLKGQAPLGNHTHLDAGSVALEVGGTQWGFDIGYGTGSEGGKYTDTAPDGERWTYPQTRPEWHSTVRVTGAGADPGHVVGAEALVRVAGNKASVDLGAVLPGVQSATREVLLAPDTLLITDVVKAKAGKTPLEWTWITDASVARSGDGFILSKDGESVNIRFADLPTGATLAIEKAPSSVNAQAGDSLIRIRVVIPAAAVTNISVQMDW